MGLLRQLREISTELSPPSSLGTSTSVRRTLAPRIILYAQILTAKAGFSNISLTEDGYMRVGVLTFHHTYNYGAVMQAFALTETIRGLGHSVEILNYDSNNNDYYLTFENDLILKTRPPFLNLHREKYRRKDTKFEEFIGKYLPATSPLRTKSELDAVASELDVIVVGSDEVWRLYEGWYPAYFLDFGPQKLRRVSYAASFGGTSDPGAHRDELTRSLEQFNVIMVRDENSQRIVTDLLGVVPDMTFDPVLLNALGRLEIEAPAPSTSTNSVLVYSERQLAPREVLAVRRKAKELNARIIALGFPHWFADENIIDAGPLDFLAAVRSAKVIATGTFHGVVFGLLYEKQLLVFATKKKANKVASLLGEICLLSKFGDLSGEAIDYSVTTPRIQEIRERSLGLLSDSIVGSSSAP